MKPDDQCSVEGCNSTYRMRRGMCSTHYQRFMKHGSVSYESRERIDPALKGEYRSYHHAKGRCENTNDRQYSDYGGRGIEFRFTSFSEFIGHIGPRPSSGYSVDRIDNDGHYEPGNVRWATKRQQNLNQRNRRDNTSGFRGVIWHNATKRWYAYVRINGKRKHLGSFVDKLEAAYLRDQFALQIYGDDYKTNLLTTDEMVEVA